MQFGIALALLMSSNKQINIYKRYVVDINALMCEYCPGTMFMLDACAQERITIGFAWPIFLIETFEQRFCRLLRCNTFDAINMDAEQTLEISRDIFLW